MPDSKFEQYIGLFHNIMTGMHACFGDRIEFILHDVSKPESSVVAVVGNVTNRQIGAPLTNIVIEALQQYGDDAEDILGYSSLSKDGRPLKSSTMFIRNKAGKIVGCLCYNLDLTDIHVAEKLLQSLSGIGGPKQSDKDGGEIFAQDIGEMVEEICRQELDRNCKPVPMMTKSDKLQLVGALDEKGVFSVKNSAEMVAHLLGTSVYTIYNYLKEIRNKY